MYVRLVRVLKECRRELARCVSQLARLAVGSVVLTSILISLTTEAMEMRDYPELLTLAEQMIDQGYDRSELQRLFGAVEFKQSIIDAMTKPAEKSMTWKDYRGLFIKPERIQQGLEFWETYQQELAKASTQYGVAEEVVVAIIGVESRFGQYRGKYGVFESLATLVSGYPRRSAFFAGELKAFLQLCNEQGFNPLEVKGSYAGAVGYPQFIATSYRAYAVDFNADDRVDLINDPVDAIGSVANYFDRHDWQAGEPVISELSNYSDELLKSTTTKLNVDRTVADIERTGAKLVDILAPDLKVGVVALDRDTAPVVRVAHHNFYVITKYNRSTMYAMAVYELSQAIKAAMLEAR
ncbi:MAG: lytic murein transglycosylase B [Arenicellaceae bacterium]|nr:lytic murein transglycosylase B [Arenicellaceae bacterium]